MHWWVWLMMSLLGRPNCLQHWRVADKPSPHSHYRMSNHTNHECLPPYIHRYDSARSTVDAILGQKFHPLFPRQRRSCDHQRGCGSYPTTSDQGYGEGVALVMSEGEQVRSLPCCPYTNCSLCMCVWLA